MADHVDITLWIDRRWKDAIEKHLKGETLQEHLEDVLDTLCNQLPEQEYARISCAIQSEAAAQRAKKEGARTYAAYHVTERGQEWYFKTSLGEELLAVGKKLRGYLTKGNGAAPDKFIGMFFGGQPITAKEFDALTALRMENTGKVRGVFDLNFDKREFSAVHIMDGWQTWAMRDVSAAVYHATRSQFASSDDKWRKLLDHLSGKEITSAGHLSARNFSFSDEIMMEENGKERAMPPHAHPPATVPRMGHHLRGGIPCGGTGGSEGLLCRSGCADPRHRAEVPAQADGAEDQPLR